MVDTQRVDAGQLDWCAGRSATGVSLPELEDHGNKTQKTGEILCKLMHIFTVWAGQNSHVLGWNRV